MMALLGWKIAENDPLRPDWCQRRAVNGGVATAPRAPP
jgi:hypothetical protein